MFSFVAQEKAYEEINGDGEQTIVPSIPLPFIFITLSLARLPRLRYYALV